jgi:hypothetical protein
MIHQKHSITVSCKKQSSTRQHDILVSVAYGDFITISMSRDISVYTVTGRPMIHSQQPPIKWVMEVFVIKSNFFRLR